MSVFLYVTTKPILTNLQQSCIFGHCTRTSNNCEIRFNKPQFWLKKSPTIGFTIFIKVSPSVLIKFATKIELMVLKELVCNLIPEIRPLKI